VAAIRRDIDDLARERRELDTAPRTSHRAQRTVTTGC
jgi:hypothetical protein